MRWARAPRSCHARTADGGCVCQSIAETWLSPAQPAGGDGTGLPGRRRSSTSTTQAADATLGSREPWKSTRNSSASGLSRRTNGNATSGMSGSTDRAGGDGVWPGTSVTGRWGCLSETRPLRISTAPILCPSVYAPEIERQMKRLFDSLAKMDRRRYAAIEATKLGHGFQAPILLSWRHLFIRGSHVRRKTTASGHFEHAKRQCPKLAKKVVV
jgi:hypothetical protein